MYRPDVTAGKMSLYRPEAAAVEVSLNRPEAAAVEVSLQEVDDNVEWVAGVVDGYPAGQKLAHQAALHL